MTETKEKVKSAEQKIKEVTNYINYSAVYMRINEEELKQINDNFEDYTINEIKEQLFNLAEIKVIEMKKQQRKTTKKLALVTDVLKDLVDNKTITQKQLNTMLEKKQKELQKAEEEKSKETEEEETTTEE